MNAAEDAHHVGMNADTQCVECGYALLGLADSAACPECGRAIEESVHPTLFAFLTDSDAKKLVQGTNRLLLLLPLSATFLLLLVGTVYTGGDEMVITCLISLTILVAVWLLGWNAIAGVRVAGTGSFLVRAAIGACILGVLLPLYAAFVDIPTARVTLLLLSVAAASFTAVGAIGGYHLNKVVRRAGDEEQHIVVSASCFGGATALFLLMGLQLFGDKFAGVLALAGSVAWLAGLAWLLTSLFSLQRMVGRRCDRAAERASRAHR